MRSKEFTISREIAVAIINDDCSGLYTEELVIDKWLEEEGIEYITVSTSYEEAIRNGEEPTRFTQCDVTGLGNDCIDIIAYKQ